MQYRQKEMFVDVFPRLVALAKSIVGRVDSCMGADSIQAYQRLLTMPSWDLSSIRAVRKVEYDLTNGFLLTDEFSDN